jgi:hypothetical protein
MSARKVLGPALFSFFWILLFAGNSFAAIITQHISWDFSESINSSTDERIQFDASFYLFDSSLGKLTSVQFNRISAIDNAYVYVTNPTEDEGNINANFSTSGYVTSFEETGFRKILFSAFSGVSSTIDPFQYDYLVAGAGLLNDAGGINFEVSGNSFTYFDVLGYVSLNNFIGTRSFDLSPVLDIDFQIHEISSNLQVSFEPKWTHSYDLIYHYEPLPTPEPSTMLMLGVGLGGLVLYRRRIKK